MTYAQAEQTVFAKFKEIVTEPVSKYGFGDVGDVLIEFLCGRIGPRDAIEQMEELRQFYARRGFLPD